MTGGSPNPTARSEQQPKEHISCGNKLLPPPSAKRKVCTAPGNPLPVPLKGFGAVPGTGSSWPTYRAVLVGGTLLVTDPGHVKALHQNGFFGHGVLSDRGLDYEILSKKLTSSQVKRKLQWRTLELACKPPVADHTSARSNCRIPTGQPVNNLPTKLTSVYPEKYGCQIPKKYIYVVSDGPEQKLEEETEEQDSLLTVDPYPVEESLVLLPEEAMFLCFGLCCLVVTDSNGEPYNVDRLWAALLGRDSNLAYRYPAYHSLRADGWVVKAADRYSADYMLYAVGPLYYHSQFLVRVEAYDVATKLSLGSDVIQDDAMFNVLDRAASKVQKMFMLCLVLRPPSLVSPANIREWLQQLRLEQLPFTRLDIDSIENPGGETEE